MQLVVEFSVDAEEYVSRGVQRSVAAPHTCPHCRVRTSLAVLGYYHRNITGRKSAVLRLAVRRFRCKACGKTVSILPAFAQPYRLIHNRTIHRFFCGHRKDEDTRTWLGLLRRYWKRFGWWVSRANTVLHHRLEHAPPYFSPSQWWAAVVAAFGSLTAATTILVTDSQVTLFGKYRCHRPNVSPL